MSTTACWATNKSFDCAWVYYGYGSRHDMIRSSGFWLSLEGICILAEYDYDYNPHSVHLDTRGEDNDRILIDRLGIEVETDGYVEIDPSRYHELPKEIIMRASAITIKHPDGLEKSLEWFDAALAASGAYPRKKYEEAVIHQNCSEQFSEFKWNLPSEEVIKDINPYHYECHKNVRLREKLCIDSLRINEKWKEQWGGCLATEEDIKAMLDGWQQEAEAAHEEFKKKNVWEQL